ncbi:ATP-binding protein [Marinobacter sp. 2_MG-2023]|uniref:sensor histidine kinase n=1 Tax=Marinobacter sp. 2_MG-2023 TaxID=3062679 RepID=UPI0026E1277F|nr:ATP-binding protein [Marinobacter sp. 2_MG-2023]MDO6443610.1 ATP-binding protein [Marinobacter sp. 2_MG-2023]
MNNILTPALFLVAGVSLFSALSHLFMGINKRRRIPHLLFGMASLMSFGYIIARAAAYNASSVEELIWLRRLDVMFICLFSLFYVGFIAAFTSFVSKLWLYLMLILTAFLIAADFLLPYGIQFSERPTLNLFELPWGEIVVDMRVNVQNPWHIIYWALIISAFSYSFYGTYFLYRQGYRKRANISFIAISIFFLLSIINTLTNHGLINFFHTSDFGFTALIFMMNIDFIFSRKREKNRLRTILNSLPFGVYAKNLNGKYVFYNRNFEKFFNIRKKLNHNLLDEDVFDSKIIRIISNNEKESMDKRSLVETEIKYKSNNKIHIYHLLHFCIPGPGTSVSGTGCIVIDLSQDREQDEELHSIRNQVWFADRVIKADTIASSLAHELIQPLFAILANAQAGQHFISLGTAEKTEIEEILRDIVNDGKRAASVVNGLRTMLQHRDIPPESISLDKSIREILELLNSEFVQKRVAVETHMEDNLLVRAIKTQIQQVVLDLVINALNVIKPAGKARRKISIDAKVNQNETVVSISCSGLEIRQQTSPETFESTQLSTLHSPETGLETCKTIIEAHGGRVWAGKHRGNGVTFFFSLPLARE